MGKPGSAIDQLSIQALDLMRQVGYPIRQEVLFEVDSNLPIMGYTTAVNGKPLIVVSSWSLKSDMALGLLVHELGHVYRLETHHPSHNFALHARSVRTALQGIKLHPRQRESIRIVLNDIQDLYADDISFKAYFSPAHQTNLSEFFLSWVHNPSDEPWINAQYLLAAAFATANLARHHVPDVANKVTLATTAFLNHIAPVQASAFDYFKTTMINFPEDVSPADFQHLLTDYLSKFVKIASI
jgi:hypothetical protein